MELARSGADFVEWWVDVNARFSGCITCAEVYAQADKEVQALGFDCFAYGCRPPVPFNQPITRISGTYPDEWLKHYNHCGYGAIDPSIIKARELGLVVWAEQKEMLDSQFFREASEWHLNEGVTFMMRGRDQSIHVLGVSRRSEAVSAAEALVLKLKLRCLTELLDEYLRPSNTFDSTTIPLTDREIEVLRWIADGKCSKGVSEILNVSENTINFHVKSIQRKFGSSNRVFAAAYAAALGVI